MTKNAWLFAGVVSTALFGGFGCGDDEPDPVDSGSPDGGDGDGDGDGDAGAGEIVLRVATFNAGLLDTVGFVPERQPLVNEAVAELEADLVCMQEVWLDEHWDALADANEDARPHTFRLPALPGVEGDCSPEELEPLRACSEMMCEEGSDLLSCTIEMCPDEVRVLTGACASCLVTNGSSGDLDMITAACLGTGMSSDEPLPPEERSYLLGGSFGTGILSRLPIMEMDSLPLDSSTTRRAVLYVAVDVPELGEVAVFCTHLSAVLNDVRYEGSFGDWEGENTAQVEEMIAWIDEKAGDGVPTIVLGDLNTSPESSADGIVEEVPESYAQWPEAGYDNAFLESDAAACTFCTDNALVASEDTGTGGAIDHILTRDITSSIVVERIFDQTVGVMGDEDAGVPDELPLSDHYGLSATFSQ